MTYFLKSISPLRMRWYSLSKFFSSSRRAKALLPDNISYRMQPAAQMSACGP